MHSDVSTDPTERVHYMNRALARKEMLERKMVCVEYAGDG